MKYIEPVLRTLFKASMPTGRYVFELPSSRLGVCTIELETIKCVIIEDFTYNEDIAKVYNKCNSSSIHFLIDVFTVLIINSRGIKTFIAESNNRTFVDGELAEDDLTDIAFIADALPMVCSHE